MPRDAHPKSPQRFTQPQWVACLLLTQYLNLSHRNTEEWLLASAEVREVLGLTQVPDHTTIARMLKRLTLARLEALLTQVLSQLEGKEDVVAIDATGFRLTSASAYDTTRRGRKYRDWVKGVYVVGTRSQMILAGASAHHVVHEPEMTFRARTRITCHRFLSHYRRAGASSTVRRFSTCKRMLREQSNRLGWGRLL